MYLFQLIFPHILHFYYIFLFYPIQERFIVLYKQNKLFKASSILLQHLRMHKWECYGKGPWQKFDVSYLNKSEWWFISQNVKSCDLLFIYYPLLIYSGSHQDHMAVQFHSWSILFDPNFVWIFCLPLFFCCFIFPVSIVS